MNTPQEPDPQPNHQRTFVHLIITSFAIGLTSCIVVAPSDKTSPGPAETVEPKPGSPCGANGQRPCNVWERVPSCDSGLIDNVATKRCETRPARTASKRCGLAGQTPCKIWERIPSCDRGLVEDFLAGKCVRTGQASELAKIASQILKDTGGLIRVMATAVTCIDPKLLENAVRRNDPTFAKSLILKPCYAEVMRVAMDEGYQTLTIGLSGGGAFVLGAFLDTGFAFDLRGAREPTLYQTKAISIGFQAGGGAALNVGVYKGSNAVNTAGSDTQGLTFEAGVGTGGGVGVWFDYEGKLDGISASVIAGASGKAGAYNRINTSYYSVTGKNPTHCGGQDQAACKVWERLPSCDPGLVENLLQGKCRKKTPCGGNNQRACKVWERTPSCNKGLYEVIGKGVCKKKKSFKCGRKNQRPCKVWERVPSCNPGLKEHFFKGKCV